MSNQQEITEPRSRQRVVSQDEITPRRLAWRRRQAMLVLWLERLAQSFWSAFGFLALGMALIRWSGAFTISSRILTAVLVILGIFMLIAIWRGVRNFQLPHANDAIARLDVGVSGRPFGTLHAKQCLGQHDEQSRSLWAIHLTDMSKRAQSAPPPSPKVRLSSIDPFAFRLIALLALFSAFAFAPTKPLKVLFGNGVPEQGALAALGPSFEGWAEPPLYTRKPSFYLEESGGSENLKLPQNTIVTLRLYGEQSGFKLSETVSTHGDAVVADVVDPVGQVDFQVNRSGLIELETPNGEVRVWAIEVIPDTAPTIELTAPISRTLRGSMTVPFRATDDYGVSSGNLTIALRLEDVDRRYGLALPPEPQDEVLLDLPMPFNGRTADFEETVLEELAEHPWAGLPVIIDIWVLDDAGNQGAIEPELVAMPGKRFFDDLAGAIAELRRDLLWNRENAPRIAKVLRAVTHRPEDSFQSNKAYLIVRSAIRRIEYNADPVMKDALRDEVADMLWQAALLIEDGDLNDAEERLKRAQERLSEAMENGATNEEIAELMDDLRRATDDYIKKLAENAEKNPDRQQAQSGETQELSQDLLQQMMDEIQSLMEQGRMAEAQELLGRLREMMENMQVTEGGQGRQGDQKDGQTGEELADTLREQQDLSDDTFQELQRQFNENRQRQQAENGQGEPSDDAGDQIEQSELDPNGQEGSPQSEPNAEGQGQSDQSEQGEGQSGQEQQMADLAGRQQALRDMLDRQQRALGNDNSAEGQVGRDALDRAQEGMSQAQESLEEGDISGALDKQADAMEALREGIQNLDQGNQQANGQAGPEGQELQGEGTQNALGSDPLGRPTGQEGSNRSDAITGLPEDDLRKSREVLDEIRRRSGEQTRPKIELDYLKRLLERF